MIRPLQRLRRFSECAFTSIRTTAFAPLLAHRAMTTDRPSRLHSAVSTHVPRVVLACLVALFVLAPAGLADTFVNTGSLAPCGPRRLRRCCLTARCWSREVRALGTPSPVRKSTIHPQAFGRHWFSRHRTLLSNGDAAAERQGARRRRHHRRRPARERGLYDPATAFGRPQARSPCAHRSHRDAAREWQGARRWRI
jgi:hypothetical protein